MAITTLLLYIFHKFEYFNTKSQKLKMIIKTKYAEHINTLKMTWCHFTEVTAIYIRCSKTGLKMKGAAKYRFLLSIFTIHSFWKTKEQKQENFTKKPTFPWIHVQPPLCLSEKTNSIYGLSSCGTGGIKLWSRKGFGDFEQTHTATASTCQLLCQQDVIRKRQMLKRFVLPWHLKRTGK